MSSFRSEFFFTQKTAMTGMISIIVCANPFTVKQEEAKASAKIRRACSRRRQCHQNAIPSVSVSKKGDFRVERFDVAMDTVATALYPDARTHLTPATANEH